MERRVQEDRRRTTVRGVTGYDRRKWTRRASQGDAVPFKPGTPTEYHEPQSDDLDFTIPKRFD